MLEALIKKLRALVKLIEKSKKNIVHTDFEDELGEATKIDLPALSTGKNLTKFKDNARQFLREHESHLSLQRLRRNQPLTPSDLEELSKMLVQAGGSVEIIQQATEQSHGLGIFIRSLVGLDRETAKQAFSQFVVGTTATASQLEFIDLIVQYLTENGVMDAARLYFWLEHLHAKRLGLRLAERHLILINHLVQCHARACKVKKTSKNLSLQRSTPCPAQGRKTL